MKICCIDGCGDACESGRRYCHKHYLERKRIQASKRYAQFGRHKYNKVCEICGKSFLDDRPTARFCSLNCYHEYTQINSSSANNNYERAHGHKYCFMHRRIAEELLNRKLSIDEVVHHLDGNVHNNDPSNLIVMSRQNHTKLHAKLTQQRAALLKNKDENSENCWDNLRDQVTTTWLETTGVNVIKISDIGQSAAETRNVNE